MAESVDKPEGAPEATFEIIPGRYWACLGFIAWRERDLMFGLWRAKDGQYVGRARFRHYKDNKVWGSDDVKTEYDISAAPREKKEFRG